MNNNNRLEEMREKWEAQTLRLAGKAADAAVLPAAEDVLAAREIFQQRETRDLFYRVSDQLITQALDADEVPKISEALAVFLLTWNRQHYRFHDPGDNFLTGLEKLLEANADALAAFRHQDLVDFCPKSDPKVGVCLTLFDRFETQLGPVGAAKALHKLAGNFFPLWDRKIAAHAYAVPLQNDGLNCLRYVAVMGAARGQVTHLAKLFPNEKNLLKLLDEFNYSTFAKGWMELDPSGPDHLEGV